MRKLKYVLALLLTAVIITLGAIAPVVAARIQDHMASWKTEYMDISQLNLLIRDPQAEGIKPFESLLFLYRSADITTITGPVSQETSSAIQDLAYQKLQPYIEAGLIYQRVCEDPIMLTPMLAVSGSPDYQSRLYWEVEISGQDGEDWYSLTMVLDNETGCVLGIAYRSAQWNTAGIRQPQQDELETAFQTLFDLYTQGLDIEDSGITVKNYGWESGTGMLVHYFLFQSEDVEPEIAFQITWEGFSIEPRQANNT